MHRRTGLGRKAARQLTALARQQGIPATRLGPEAVSIGGRTARLKVAYHGYRRLERLLDGADRRCIRMGTRSRWLALMPAELLMALMKPGAL